MSEPFRLGLRGHRHMVGLIRHNGGRTQLVLGQAYAQGTNPRQHILDQWGIEAGSPRKRMQATADTPLPLRHRVALAAHLPAETQAVLRTGFDYPPVGRRDTVSGVKGRMHLLPDAEPLRNGLPPLGRLGGAPAQPRAGKPKGGK